MQRSLPVCAPGMLVGVAEGKSTTTGGVALNVFAGSVIYDVHCVSSNSHPVLSDVQCFTPMSHRVRGVPTARQEKAALRAPR